jgi:fermentation-respiration switch protein FrsA (DUF1100 family)
MASIKTWRSPVLLIHGDDDRNVAFSETVNLVRALRAQGVYFEQLIIPDEIHDFPAPCFLAEGLQGIGRFFPSQAVAAVEGASAQCGS